MVTQVFLKNRAEFPRAELMKYQGEWLAFSADGCRIVAHAATIGQLEDQLDAMGVDAQTVVFGSIPDPDDDCCIGVGE
jgi:hypothetical protein